MDGWLLRMAAEVGCCGWLLRLAVEDGCSLKAAVDFRSSLKAAEHGCSLEAAEDGCSLKAAEKGCSSKMLILLKHIFLFLSRVGSAGHGGIQPSRHFVLLGRPKLWQSANFEASRATRFPHFGLLGRPKLC